MYTVYPPMKTLPEPDDATRIDRLLHELRDRAVRTESRIVKLGDHVGANLRTTQRITLTPQGVEIDSLDVSVSRILSEIEKAVRRDNAQFPNPIDVRCHGCLVFSLHHGASNGREHSQA